MACAIFGAARTSSATTVTFQADKDNSIFQDGTSKSAGAAQSIHVGAAGSNANGSIRRGLIYFDLTAPGKIPANAIITGASLTMYVAIAPMNIPPGPALTNVSLYALTKEWGEGASAGGLGMGTGTGANAVAPDATWLKPKFGSAPNWTTPGGDFVATITATQAIGVPTDVIHDNYVWQSTQLLTDVQSWYDDSASNFGWILRGDEATAFSNRRFFSSEFTTVNFPGQYFGPLLTVEFEIAPEPSTWALLLLGGVGILVLRRRSLRVE
ncbi:MAG: DNRLRE domain-containing protein [Planctomycetia bacterium]|nr:DNRLRE domain-containing protein [Planctomycetia bacterium]